MQPARAREPLDGLLDWLIEGLDDFDPQTDSVFFDAPGASSLDQAERVVELPWALSLYRQERKVLDVGSVYQESWYHMALEQVGATELMGLDVCAGGRDWPLLQQPQLPLVSSQFSLITCLSFLPALASQRGEGWAMAELYRLLMPGGRLLLSLPLGAGYYDQSAWLSLITSQPFTVLTLRYFCHNQGWVECYPDQASQAPLTGRVQGLGCVELCKRI
ncbi:hypothetical protein [Candidatus Cyanaurora vandensis]|uniref:hypothetical protein n=1 Tax=Candidatus Cyanaurora vandensis TaxID=2714958 RepID=UPI00257FF7EE|nr:hypothetical protein [Candidatus Cyanaurora vandensis]